MFYLIDIHYMVPYRAPKKMYYVVLLPELGAMFTKYWGSAILLNFYGEDAKSKILIIFI